MAFIEVRHNIEVAHRLFDMKGKCEAIHGHSMWVDLKIHGLVNGDGVLDGLEFGFVKTHFRKYLDGTFDHRLLLNEKDPWADKLYVPASSELETVVLSPQVLQQLPGLLTVPGDPTTENIAKWIATWAHEVFKASVDVLVRETAVNAAGYSIR